MVVLWLYVSCRIAANRAKAARKRRCGAHKTLRFANLLQARRAAVPIGGEKPARLTAVRPLRTAQTLFRQKTAFLFMDKPACKSAKKRLSQKDKLGAAGPERLRQGHAKAAAGRNGAVLRQAARKTPAACLILFTQKVRSGRLILRGPSYAQSKKTPDGRRGGGPAGRKAAGKNAQSRNGRPSGNASAGRTRRTAETAASGGFFLAKHPPAPRQSAASRRTGKADVFRPVRLVKEGAFSKPLRGRGFARLLRKAERKGDKARAGRLGGRKRVPPNARGAKVRAGGPPDGPGAGNLRRYLRLACEPLVLQQLQRTFFVLVFLYFDYDCTQSPAHRAAEKTGRTIFS